jgi:hypothetical protein
VNIGQHENISFVFPHVMSCMVCTLIQPHFFFLCARSYGIPSYLVSQPHNSLSFLCQFKYGRKEDIVELNEI